MCTISYFPFPDGDHVLTQNRDVGPSRAPAIPPSVRIYKGKELRYPVDPQGGGTWNAASDSHQACILNGAEYDYYPNFDAPKSRGSLCLDVLVEGSEFLHEEDLSVYDDFTLLYFSLDKKEDIHEFRWDGKNLKERRKNAAEPQFWISRGLYSFEDYQRKKTVFDHFIESEVMISDLDQIALEIWNFHLLETVAGKEGFLIDRPGMVRTVSVLQSVYQDKKIKIRYQDGGWFVDNGG